ncbi:MAG: hypothetical protein ACRBCK_12115 [Alphaproteobacteria bacterium]
MRQMKKLDTTMKMLNKELEGFRIKLNDVRSSLSACVSEEKDNKVKKSPPYLKIIK